MIEDPSHFVLRHFSHQKGCATNREKPNAKPQSLSLETQRPGPRRPRIPSYRLSTVVKQQNAAQQATQAAKERPTKEPSLPANSTPNRRDPAYTPAYTPRQPPCPEPRKPLILRHADPPNGKLQPLCPGRLLPIFVEVFRAVRAPSIQRASRRAYRSNPHHSGDRSAPLRP
jgi:hypothetical protein